LGTEKTVHIVNPLSKELDVMRQSLLFGVLETIIRNQNQKVSDVKIYEFGKVYGYNQQLKESGDVTKTYQETKYLGLAVCGSLNRESWNKDTQKAGFYFLRSKMEQVFKKMGLDVSKLKFQELENDLFAYGLILLYRKEPVAMIGQLAAKLLKYFDIKQEVAYAEIDWNVLLKIHATTKFKYESLPKFPPVRRDLALLVSKSIKFSEIESLALQTETKLLKKVGLFDIFEGEKIGAEKKSYAVSFILRDDEKTLTDEQVDKTMERLLKAFREKLGAELR
jgi:phenylalanyl-tRNA synthetase beta chain